MADPGKALLKTGKKPDYDRIFLPFNLHRTIPLWGKPGDFLYALRRDEGKPAYPKSPFHVWLGLGPPAARCRDFPGHLPGMPDRKDNPGSYCPAASPRRKRWGPNGYGPQPLYELLIRLENPDERLVQEEKKTIGLRTLTVSREKDQWGREFAFTVNGVKIFAMGANYIPEDCVYSRITKERQAYLLEWAGRANFNCIRVWGGGYYPSDAFYELCDEKGLIVWQDLMFACNVYEGTEHFLDNCRQEVLDNVRRLRHHPALGLWCGNNEIESAWDHWEDFQKESMYLRADYIKLFEQVIPDAVRQADPDTFFWPSSPSSGGCFADPDAESDGVAPIWMFGTDKSLSPITGITIFVSVPSLASSLFRG